ncbi:DsrE/DsrF/DrsH-like family protein [Alicyclobacillus sp. SO9]|uniref:DsrE/DsrF/DrsH-like family protein n=1 Tax=Alicyclobacillus sp. SO9 TaxID=2665646 RepID=UPI0018E7693E|nr:DsrE/DsrF/DrsH-like family protein [Alicyclobacillus sp. SO9]QQE79337.1 DsrE/DsrF/DrsH-like family protein [Alicyclobacillus sp. SO9]
MTRRVAIIASNGGMETAYKVLNIATTAAATDAEVAVFFTFDGLEIIRKDAQDILSFGQGKEHYKERFQSSNIPPVGEMLELALESDIKLIACQMTMDVMGLSRNQFLDEIEVGGAMSFLDFAYDADVSLTF